MIYNKTFRYRRTVPMSLILDYLPPESIRPSTPNWTEIAYFNVKTSLVYGTKPRTKTNEQSRQETRQEMR